MKDNSPTITPDEAAIIEAVLTTRTLGDAAEKAKVSYICVYRTIRRPHVKAEIDRRTDAVLCSAVRKLKCVTEKAALVIADQLDQKAPSMKKVLCADKALSIALKYIDVHDLLTRVQQIENEKSKPNQEGRESPPEEDGNSDC